MSKYVAADSPSSAEPPKPAGNGSDSSPRIEKCEYRRTAAQLLWNRALESAPSEGESALGEAAARGRKVPTPEQLSRAASAAVEDVDSSNRAKRWRRARWAALALLLILPAAIALATIFPVSRLAGSIEGGGGARSTKLYPLPPDGNSPSQALFADPAAPSSVVADRPPPIEPERDARSRDADRGAPDMNPTATIPTAPAPPPAVVADRSAAKLGSAFALLPEGMTPRVLIRYLGGSAKARRRAETVVKALAENGVEVADMRESASALRNELSFSYAPDGAFARQVGRLAGISPTRAPLSKEGLTARPGMVQLSISGR